MSFKYQINPSASPEYTYSSLKCSSETVILYYFSFLTNVYNYYSLEVLNNTYNIGD